MRNAEALGVDYGGIEKNLRSERGPQMEGIINFGGFCEDVSGVSERATRSSISVETWGETRAMNKLALSFSSRAAH